MAVAAKGFVDFIVGDLHRMGYYNTATEENDMPAPLTDKQRHFAVEYAMNGGNATAAAKSAGYSEASAHEIGRQTLAKPHVIELVRSQLHKMKAQSGAIGLRALVQICEDEKAPTNARVSAARALCEHAGLLGSVRDASVGSIVDADDYHEVVDAREVIRAFKQVALARSMLQ